MISSKVNIAGIELSTPFLIGSGAYASTGEQIKHCVKEMAKNHWAGIVTKSYVGLGMMEAFRLSKPYMWTNRALRTVGMQNYAMKAVEINDETLEELAQSVIAAHEYGLVIIGSLDGAPEATYTRLARSLSETGIDGIELNLGCPAARIEELEIMTSVTGEESYASYHAEKNINLVAKIVSDVCKATKLPVFAKLPSVDTVILAQVCRKAGVAGVSAINTVGGFMGIDIETTIPIASDIGGRGRISGLSGPMIKPIALSMILDISLSMDVPIFGLGGVSKWQDAVEFLMVGASAVQICTAFMWKGFSLGTTMYNGLMSFMKRKGYQSIIDFRGASLKYMKVEPSVTSSVVANIDRKKCNLCGKCYIACDDSSYGAVVKEDDFYSINIHKCDGCGLCKVVCPSEAITLKAF
jgi:dihydropyrimidine dehydrogenase (NAD+) subunit PreA